MEMNSDSFDELSCVRPKNDVFLNYMFKDIGKSFISHLKGGLTRNSFTVFDNTMLPIGQDESSELLKAIEESEIYLVIFSINYPFSIQCLDELVLIMDSLPKFKKRKVFPIFFKVDPSHVRSQRGGSFMEAFDEHENNDLDPDRVRKWRQVLKDASQLSGLTLRNGIDEAEFVLKVIKELEKIQSPQDLHVTDHHVGIGSRAEELISTLRLDFRGVLVVGVFGISGIGKTTIVKAVYNRISAEFDVSCFLADIHYHCRGPNWKVDLPKLLISCLTHDDNSIMHHHNDCVTKILKFIRGRKILMVLDDVDNFQQLKALGINPGCFNSGSRIIVTTRDKHSLVYIPYTSYHTKLLNERESLTLFSGLMFLRHDLINTEFIEEVVRRAGGLPLVLKVWSSHFRQYGKEQWTNILETLKRIPHGDVQKQLQMSYDSLPDRSKKLFLDITCFFDGWQKDCVIEVLQDEDLAFFLDHEIQYLVDKSLINTDDDSFFMSMHHAIREMGQEVVRQENEDEPGKRSRLMDHRDVISILRDCSGTESVESIQLDIFMEESVTVKVEAIKKMSNPRFIQFIDRYQKLSWSSSSSKDRMSSFTFKKLSNENESYISLKKLKYLEWDYFPLKCIDIDMENVVVIKLQNSNLKKLWKRFKDEDSAFFPDHEIQYLVDKSLVKIDYEDPGRRSRVSMHHAIREMGQEVVRQENEDEPGKRSRLMDHRDVISILRDCSGTESVESIQLDIFMEESVTVKVEAIKKMSNLRFIQLIDRYQKLSWSSSSSKDRMSSFTFKKLSNENESYISLKKLKYLEWDYFPLKCINIDMDNVVVIRLRNSNLKKLWKGFKSLKKLRILDVSFSRSLTKTGNFVGLEKLEELHFRYCEKLEELDGSIGCLGKLLVLDLHECKKLKRFPWEKICKLRSRKKLDLGCCPHIELERVKVIDPFMSSLKECRITRLDLSYCKISKISPELGNLKSLIYLNLSGNRFRSLPDSLCQLHELKKINLSYCTNLKSIPNLPPNIKEVTADNCISLVNLPSNMSELPFLTGLDLNGCMKLEPEGFMKVTGLRNLVYLSMRNCNVSEVSSEIGNLVSLEELDLSENTFSSLPDSFSNLSKLGHLKINDCSELELFPLVPSKLKHIEANGCGSLNNFPCKRIQDSFFSQQLRIGLSMKEVPNWCSYTSNGDELSFVAPPMQHLDNKIFGVIVCATSIKDCNFIWYPYFYPIMVNQTKETRHNFDDMNIFRCSMTVMFRQLNDKTLVVEPGDTIRLQFHEIGAKVVSCGLRLIYEGETVPLQAS